VSHVAAYLVTPVSTACTSDPTFGAMAFITIRQLSRSTSKRLAPARNWASMRVCQTGVQGSDLVCEGPIRVAANNLSRRSNDSANEGVESLYQEPRSTPQTWAPRFLHPCLPGKALFGQHLPQLGAQCVRGKARRTWNWAWEARPSPLPDSALGSPVRGVDSQFFLPSALHIVETWLIAGNSLWAWHDILRSSEAKRLRKAFRQSGASARYGAHTWLFTSALMKAHLPAI